MLGRRLYDYGTKNRPVHFPTIRFILFKAHHHLGHKFIHLSPKLPGIVSWVYAVELCQYGELDRYFCNYLKLCQMSKKINKFNQTDPSVYSAFNGRKENFEKKNFPINFFNFNGKNCFSPIENWINRWKNIFINLFAHLAELEMLKYLPSFPYRELQTFDIFRWIKPVPHCLLLCF